MKLSKRALTTLISVLISLTVTGTSVGVGTVSLLSSLEDHTDNTNQQIIEENVSLESAINYHIVEAMEDVSKTGKIEVKLNEYETNRILYAVSKKIAIPDVHVRSMYVEFLDDEYKLFIPLTVMDIDTLFSCNLSLNEKNNVISAELTDIQIGKLHKGSIKTALNIAEKKLKEALAEYFVTAEINDNEIKATISREDLKRTVDKLTDKEPIHDIVTMAYDIVFLQTNTVKLNLSDPNALSVVVDLICFGGYKSNRFDTVNDTLNNYVAKGIVDESNINLVSKYVVNGYDRLNDEEKNEITAILSSVESEKTITHNIGYFSNRLSPDKALDIVVDKFAGNYFGGLMNIINKVTWWKVMFIPLYTTAKNIEIAHHLIATDKPGFVAKNDLQNLVNSFDVLGITIPIMSDISEQTAHVIVESTNLEIGDNGLYLNVGINVNGYVIPLKIDITLYNKYSDNISFNISNVMLGDFSLSSQQVSTVCHFIAQNVRVSGVSFSGTYINIDTATLIFTYLDIPFLSHTSLDLLLQGLYIDFEEGQHIQLCLDAKTMLWDNILPIAVSIFSDAIDYFT